MAGKTSISDRIAKEIASLQNKKAQKEAARTKLGDEIKDISSRISALEKRKEILDAAEADALKILDGNKSTKGE